MLAIGVLLRHLPIRDRPRRLPEKHRWKRAALCGGSRNHEAGMTGGALAAHHPGAGCDGGRAGARGGTARCASSARRSRRTNTGGSRRVRSLRAIRRRTWSNSVWARASGWRLLRGVVGQSVPARFQPDAVFSTGGYGSSRQRGRAPASRPLVVYLPMHPGWAVKAERMLATE